MPFRKLKIVMTKSKLLIFFNFLITVVSVFILIILTAQLSEACTRCVYKGPDYTIITGRSMDWMEDTQSNLWIFPQGMNRNGNGGENSLTWVSKYGSVVTSGYESGSADGMNEKGLVANLLYLAESEFGNPVASKPNLSIGGWVQYVLDNYATVSEAVDALSKDEFTLIAPVLPNGSKSTLHLAVSDVTGDNAIFEYIGGKLVIHHSPEYQVMTNSPVFDQQLALNEYWKNIGGLVMLPGTNRASDRFVRASFYIGAVTQTSDELESVAAVFSVMRNVSVPLGISIPGQPNIASTIWRTVADQKNKVYYFESTKTPNVFWVDMKDIDFSASAPVKKLTMTGGKIFAGNTVDQFEPSAPFVFMSAK